MVFESVFSYTIGRGDCIILALSVVLVWVQGNIFMYGSMVRGLAGNKLHMNGHLPIKDTLLIGEILWQKVC